MKRCYICDATHEDDEDKEDICPACLEAIKEAKELALISPPLPDKKPEAF